MLDSAENQFLTAKEVAEKENVHPKTVKARCIQGKYPGAYKAAPTPENPHGTWYIPSSLSGPIKDVTIKQTQKNLTADEFLSQVREAIQAEVQAAVTSQTDTLKQEMRQLRSELEAHHRHIDEQLREAVKPKSFLQRLLGRR